MPVRIGTRMRTWISTFGIIIDGGSTTKINTRMELNSLEFGTNSECEHYKKKKEKVQKRKMKILKTTEKDLVRER